MDSALAALRTINHVPAMLAYWSADQRCVFANAAYLDWFGRTPQDMLGMSMQELLGPLYELNLPYITGVLAGTPQRFEREITLPDGRVRHSSATYTPDIVDGVVVGFTALVTDMSEMHQREERLRLALELLDRTGALAKVGGAELRLRTGEVYWTKEMCRMLDVDPGRIPPSERWVDFFEPEALPAYLAASEQLRANGNPIDVVTPMITATGRRIWVRIQASAVTHGGDVVALIAAHQDVTEQKRAEDALREHDGFLEGVLDSIEDMVAVLDERGTIVAVNRAWRRQAEEYGAPALATQAIGMDYLAVLDRSASRAESAEAREAAAGIREILAGGSDSYTLEYACSSPTGTLRWFLLRVVPYAGPRRGAVVSHHDITRARAEDEARRLSDAALRAVSQGVVITDPAQRIVWINDTFTAVTGYDRASIVGKSMKCLQGPLSDAETVSRMREAVRDGRDFSGEICNYRRDGSPFWNELTISPVRDRSQRITHFVGVVRDVTARHEAAAERAALQGQLQRAQRLESVGRLAGGVAHDFNNMLSVILGHVELALLQLQPDQPICDDLLYIRNAAQRSAELTRQLLAFARKQVIMPTALDVNASVAESVRLLRRLIGENVRIVVEQARDLWLVHMDPSQLDQIVTNLCVNARDAIADVGTITIATANCSLDAAFCARHVDAVPGDFVRLRVSDTGHGMNEETLAQIFEPFFTTKTVGEGTGLGLATVYGAVHQNAGFITVESAPGEGSTFDVYLPRGGGRATPAPPDEASHTESGGHETILVVEDEDAILALTVRVLERRGYRVLAASSPRDALGIASSDTSIDLLLTDVVMPMMNGRDLARAIRRTRPGLACLFMSGYPADVIEGRGMMEAGEHFLQKPCPEALVARKVREVLDEVARR